MDDTSLSPLSNSSMSLLALPAEIRIAIFEHVFNDDILQHGFINHNRSGGIALDDHYRASTQLRPFYACRQLYDEANSMAWNKTNFIASSRFIHIGGRLFQLNPQQIAGIRNISFVADAHHFRDFIQWNQDPFGLSNLRLDTLTIVLHCGGRHYLYEFTSGITSLLRRLQNVRKIIFVRNQALVKGGFRTWYNRLIGLIMKVDHFQRYDHIPATPEKVWWKWQYDEIAQTICLEALPARPLMGEEAYMQSMKPLMEDFRVSMEKEDTSLPARHDGWGSFSQSLTS